MTSAFVEQADRNQARASDPGASAWVSANAGTGKTEVLVKRTLRLLLAGARPECILCLTYTKTAAAEMQNRLLTDLSAWATLPEADLRQVLKKLLGQPPETGDMRRARRLFALSLEARGGLKIYTIHGFCERLLQRFPLEAGVTPHFSVLDEHGATALMHAAFDTVLADAAADWTSALGQALDTIVTVAGEDSFRQVVNAVLDKRGELARMADRHDGIAEWAQAEAVALKRLFDIEGVTEEVLNGEFGSVLDDDELDALLRALAEYGARRDDKKTEDGLREVRTSTGRARIVALRKTFLTAAGKPRARVYNAEFRKSAPDLAIVLEQAQDRVTDLDLKLAQLRAAEASGAVLVLAEAILDVYSRQKLSDGALDYDDLIGRARHLLSRAGASAWVRYKIDGGIDHILVDEAQDTNPEQWAIIEALADEFFAGAGARESAPTLFAVGDEKQSIYSFQGASPAHFGKVGRKFRTHARDASIEWVDVPLNVSFRSTVPVLAAVDEVFGRPEAAQGLTFVEGERILHHAYRQGQAGLVELWDLEAEVKPDPMPAFAPWTEGPATARAVDVLCARIAGTIKAWLRNDEPLPSAGRPIRAGDILILVRRRDPFTAPMIRALKHEQIPVAGADRMRLMDQLAVQDLVCLADLLLLPEDDLALATVLKSPLFGLDDDALFALAHGRSGSLWAALKVAADDPRFAEAAVRLQDWLSRADFMPPFEFFATLLGADDQCMRKRVLGRLGPEAAEAIDEFLDDALAYDREAAPSLQGFVDQLRGEDKEIKRDMDQDRDEVRIMTVHAAKGLQAPIVFLPDTSTVPRAQGPQLFPVPRPAAPPDDVPHLLWSPGRSDLEVIDDAKTAIGCSTADEYHRLLYVAMTRARDRLYVCGWRGVREPEKDCWYHLIRDGLQGHLSAVEGCEGVFRQESGQESPVPEVHAATSEEGPQPLPDWATTVTKPEPIRRRIVPSRLGLGPHQAAAGEQAPLGPEALATSLRFVRGRLIHALLQHLPDVPPSGQERAARAFMAARGQALPGQERGEIVAETLAVVRHNTFAPLFRPGSLAEVPVVARFGDGDEAIELEGQIDRLARVDGGLIILDYKTNRPAPKKPEDMAPAYIDQLAAYRLALSRLFPDEALRAAILWTDGPRLMEIPSILLDRAERNMLSGGGQP